MQVNLKAPTPDNILEWLNQPRIARCGESFIPSDDQWRPDRTVSSINIAAAKQAVSVERKPWLVAALAYHMEDYAASSMVTLASDLKLIGDAGLDALNPDNIFAIRERLHWGQFTFLRRFLAIWAENDVLAVRPDKALIDAYQAVPKKREASVDPVASLDPKKGPFTPLERDSLFQWACAAFSGGHLSMERFVYLRLLLALGGRLRQLQQLVFGDFSKDETGYTLKLPLAKKGKGFREVFEAFKCPTDLGELLDGYRRYTLERLHAEYPGRVNWAQAIAHVAIFRATGSGPIDGKGTSRIIIDSPDLSALETGPVMALHKAARSMKELLNTLHTVPAFPVSHRTGEPIHLGTHRFRYTLGTDMAREGYSVYSIAAALTHAGTSTVCRYVKTSHEMAKRIDDRLRDEIALVVNAFTGKIITDAKNAVNHDDPSKQLRKGAATLAVCGSGSGCSLDAPYVCYACPKFQPLLEADHEAVLVVLETHQRQASDSDKRLGLAEVYDRAILACRKVILDCREIKAIEASE